MIRVSIRPNFAQPGIGGVPQRGPLLPLPFERITTYEHTIAAVGGFESQTLSFVATVRDGLYWLKQLMASNVTAGPNGRTIWEGYLSNVAFAVGGEQISISVEPVANRIICRFTYAGGRSGVSVAQSNVASQSRYGTRDAIVTANQPLANVASANAVAARYLAARAWPQATGTSSLTTGDLNAETVITLTSTGWYDTLGWVLTSRTDTTQQETALQLLGLLDNASPGIGVTNNFLADNQRNLITTGVTPPRTIDPDTSYRDKIEAMLALGTSTYERIAYGVYEGRIFKTAVWAGATPAVIHYKRVAGDSALYDTGDKVVPPWLARPDRMLLIPTLLDPAPQSGNDSAARRYVERVTCRVDGNGQSVDLEPAQSSSVDVLLARLG